MALDLGNMRDKFIIEKPVATQDAYGQSIEDWQGFKEVRGYLKHLSGRQLQLAQANTITATATYQLQMRWSSDIVVGKVRLKLARNDGTFRIFTINDINDIDNRHYELVLMLTEVKA
jgi:SPP1 family predicted phage head-tail adaptor